MKLLTTLLIACIGIGYVSVAWKGGFMTGFGSGDSLDPYSPAQILMNGIVLIWTIFLVVALWRPNKVLLVLGGLMILPLVIIGLFCLMIPPLGIALLLAPILWYRTAYTQWKNHQTIGTNLGERRKTSRYESNAILSRPEYGLFLQENPERQNLYWEDLPIEFGNWLNERKKAESADGKTPEAPQPLH